jgi:Tetratricopeptide repeat
VRRSVIAFAFLAILLAHFTSDASAQGSGGGGGGGGSGSGSANNGYGYGGYRGLGFGGQSAYWTFGGGGFGGGSIYHPGYKAGAIGAGAYDPSSNGGTRTIFVGSQSAGGVSGRGAARSSGSANRPRTPFVHAYAARTGRANLAGNDRNHAGSPVGGAIQNHVAHSPAYWRDRSYFFGYGSPFGVYLGYPWWWPGYGNRFANTPWFASGYGFGGYGYGYPYLAYRSTYPYAGYTSSPVAAQNLPPSEQLEDSLDFASQGEIAFRAGKYQQAVQDWRHALVDDPQNGAILLLLSQALFASGQHVESAGALQAALALLPEEKWGTVVTHYSELYPNIQAYSGQLRATEKLRDGSPELAPLRLMLGYHWGYLGHSKEAVKELKKAAELAPQDEITRKLRELFSARLNTLPKPAELIPDEPQDPTAVDTKS